jgi:universal stress protein A
MNKYKRILVTTDFSDINRVAVERAAILAQQDKSELIVLHVVEHFPYDGPLFSALPQNFKPLRFAQSHDVDLIVVAPHGRGVIGTLGSTAIGILNGADCDVLAVREPAESDPK